MKAFPIVEYVRWLTLILIFSINLLLVDAINFHINWHGVKSFCLNEFFKILFKAFQLFFIRKFYQSVHQLTNYKHYFSFLQFFIQILGLLIKLIFCVSDLFFLNFFLHFCSIVTSFICSDYREVILSNNFFNGLNNLQKLINIHFFLIFYDFQH